MKSLLVLVLLLVGIGSVSIAHEAPTDSAIAIVDLDSTSVGVISESSAEFSTVPLDIVNFNTNEVPIASIQESTPNVGGSKEAVPLDVSFPDLIVSSGESEYCRDVIPKLGIQIEQIHLRYLN